MAETGRIIVISGGASGIGLGIAERFAAAGDRVVLLGRDEAKLARAAARLANAETHVVDLRNSSAIAAFAARIEQAHGRVDVLVNSAGLLKNASADMDLETAEQVWDEVVDSSLKGAFLLTVALAPLLTSPGGSIVNIGSIVTQSGGSKEGYLAYTPAKAGLHGLTYASSREFAARGIRVNTVAPGYIAETGMTGDWDQERTGPILAQIPLGRSGTPLDIANAAFWLASSEASYISGVTLSVNGGWRFL